MKLFLENEKSTLQLAARLAKITPNCFSIYLQGDLGAGKTTFVRGFIREFGIQDIVKSPTYTLIESYHIVNQWIYHMDLYRLEKSSQLNELEFRDHFGLGICLVEWPEKGEGFLQKPDILVVLNEKKLGRECYLVANTAEGKKILKQLGRDIHESV